MKRGYLRGLGAFCGVVFLLTIVRMIGGYVDPDWMKPPHFDDLIVLPISYLLGFISFRKANSLPRNSSVIREGCGLVLGFGIACMVFMIGVRVHGTNG